MNFAMKLCRQQQGKTIFVNTQTGDVSKVPIRHW
jgi:hypothetical protein